VSPKALEIFLNYKWPGNIRELRNTIEHCFIMESSDQLTEAALPMSMLGANHTEVEEKEDAVIDFKGIQNSVLDNEQSEEITDQYKFTFASSENGQVRMDFQTAKDRFEAEFITQALMLNKGKINQTALNANIPKKTLLRKIEKYELNPKDYY
jgi:DNA-binding NtrC family response regulator